MEKTNAKIFDELQKALNYHKLEKSNLDYLQEKKQQEEREKLSYQQNIKELNKYIEKEIFPILGTTIKDMYKLGQCYVSSHYTGNKIPTTSELDRETLEWLDKNFCGILKEIDVPYNIFLYLDDFHNLTFKIDDVNDSYHLMDIDVKNYLNCGLTIDKSEIGYLADGKAYDILFANNKNNDVRFADIKASVLAYQDVVNETIKSKADALMWALRGDIVSFDNQIANLTREIGFTDLCNYFEINTGYNDIDDYRQARIYNDKVYILNSKGEVHNDIPIADIVEGNIHTGNIFGDDKLFLSEMIYVVFYQTPYYDEFDKELQDKLDNSSYTGWSKDFLNTLKDWDKNVEKLDEEVFEYYEPLCNWIDTNKILGTREDYLRFCIKEAEDKFIDNIKEYEWNKKLDEIER